MASELVLDVPDRLELQRRVGYVEVPSQAALQVVEDPARFAAAEALVAHDHVHGEDGQGRGERPRMQVMDRAHLRQLQQVAPDLVEVYVLEVASSRMCTPTRSCTAASSMRPTTTSEASGSARVNSVVTMRMPATMVPRNP